MRRDLLALEWGCRRCVQPGPRPSGGGDLWGEQPADHQQHLRRSCPTPQPPGPTWSHGASRREVGRGRRGARDAPAAQGTLGRVLPGVHPAAQASGPGAGGPGLPGGLPGPRVAGPVGQRAHPAGPAGLPAAAGRAQCGRQPADGPGAPGRLREPAASQRRGQPAGRARAAAVPGGAAGSGAPAAPRPLGSAQQPAVCQPLLLGLSARAAARPEGPRRRACERARQRLLPAVPGPRQLLAPRPWHPRPPAGGGPALGGAQLLGGLAPTQ